MENRSDKNLLDMLKVGDNEMLFANLKSIYSQENDCYREKVIVPFHKGVLQVLRFYLKGGNFQRKHDIRWLLARLFDIAQKPYFWQKATFDENDFLREFGSAESCVLDLMNEINQSHKSRQLISWLEESYELVTKAAGFCFGRYDFWGGLKIVRLSSSNVGTAVCKTAFRLPLFAGIVVGWLFLLQAGDAIKYFTLILDKYPEGVVLLVVTGALLSVSYLFIYFQGKRKVVTNLFVRSMVIICISWLTSFLVGLVMINKYFGFEWFKTINKDLGLCTSQLETYATYFRLTWTSMAVFIGIFAQVIWSGRGPTQFDEE